MGRRATAGTCVVTLVRMAVPVLQAAERQCPRTGPGDKPKYPDWWMAGLIMIAVLHKKKTKSAQYRFLTGHCAEVLAWLGGTRWPCRSCYFARYRRAHRLYRVAIRQQAEQALAEGVADARHVAVDKSLIAAAGPVWHQTDRRAGKVSAGVDQDGTWGYSEHDGWVFGFSYEVVVTATPGTTVFPVLASVDTASTSEIRTFADKIDDLPSTVETVSGDSGYDSNDLGERVEWDEQGRRTGRRFLCPENPRNNQRPKTKALRRRCQPGPQSGAATATTAVSQERPRPAPLRTPEEDGGTVQPVVQVAVRAGPARVASGPREQSDATACGDFQLPTARAS